MHNITPHTHTHTHTPPASSSCNIRRLRLRAAASSSPSPSASSSPAPSSCPDFSGGWVCVCVCVRARACACACACVRMNVYIYASMHVCVYTSGKQTAWSKTLRPIAAMTSSKGAPLGKIVGTITEIKQAVTVSGKEREMSRGVAVQCRLPGVRI